ncbi:MAG: roadblock/LC7 domain-containing protein [Gemmatimonadetes bacterium]|nr:roadblock/LC7 domain-containing protein [Gemmatimonadota bacterium]MCB9504935.1 roadblock/LC7 domain-containing protein [Gemmatimonadales bacterium]MCA9762302.1 roadblock/LC7 domain-containing protein [Gemmatimonadota bacterium]MCA9768711.1 roadblock/LC7 domain-containing protein [Gemmatimonadota bacterium]MCB9518254.1 roadblock/LC7 domain-containing protein [Gemmatimonadales bacterium]
MPSLADAVHTFAARPDVAGVVLLSDEGLVVGAELPSGLEAETIAALAATAQRTLTSLGSALGHGVASQIVLDAPAGTTILTRLGAGATLLVLAADAVELADLLHALRGAAPPSPDPT